MQARALNDPAKCVQDLAMRDRAMELAIRHSYQMHKYVCPEGTYKVGDKLREAHAGPIDFAGSVLRFLCREEAQ